MPPTPETDPAIPDGLPQPRRNWATVAVAFAIVMAVMDGAIANVALPTLARDLGVSPAESIWVANSYQLTIAVLLLPMAALGEIVGYRRIYLGGLVVFLLGSVACTLSNSLPTLVAGRVVQALGAAGLMAINTALIRYIYPRALLGRGIGINAVIVATSSALGPTVAGGILAVASWPWLFAVNVPLGLAALALGWRSLPESHRARRPFDVISAVLCALFFGLLVTGIDALGHGASWGWLAAQFLATVLIGTVLVRRQLGMRAPLLPLDLLRIPIFALSVGTSVCSFLAMMLAYSSLPFHLQSGFGFDAVDTGLIMTPWPLATAVVAPIAGRLADRHSAGLLGGLGLLVLAAGLSALALLPAQPSVVAIAWPMAVCGAGFGLFQSPNNRTLISAAPRERSGGAGGMLSTARTLGQTLGTALVALILARAPQEGPVIALWVGAAVALVAAGISSLRLLPGGRNGAG
ncbi:MFS transporter [Roseomonas sp. BN140053]|uniref:MFS transporter n=1 Tax=Roseomonas sp. BN140053 TaxID=3391898 RepID=UPI0039EC74C1